MEIIGKTSVFKKMLEVASIKGLFNELPIEVHNDKHLLVRCQDGAGQIAATERGIFRGFEKISAKDEMETFGVKVSKIQTFLKYFGDDETITFMEDSNRLVIAGEQYVFDTAIYDVDAIKTYVKKLKFAIDEEAKVALYKGGKLKPTTIATVQSDVLKSIANISSDIGQEYYPINLEPPNKLYCDVGSKVKDLTQDTAKFKSKDGDVLVEGTAMQTILGHGFKEVVSVLDGEVQLSGVDETAFGKAGPLWIYQIKDDYEVGFYLAPRIAQ